MDSSPYVEVHTRKRHLTCSNPDLATGHDHPRWQGSFLWQSFHGRHGVPPAYKGAFETVPPETPRDRLFPANQGTKQRD